MIARGRHLEAGYTLVEMIVVLALIALSGTALTLTFQHPESANPREIARQIAGEARAASLKAISSGESSILTLDLAARTISVDGAPTRVTIPDGLDLSMTAAERLVESGKSGSIEFLADGSSTGGEITVLSYRALLRRSGSSRQFAQALYGMHFARSPCGLNRPMAAPS